jgi:AraC-like DNA-binding protein
MDEDTEPVRLSAGDCFLLPKGQPFRLGSDLSLPPENAERVFAAGPRGSIIRCNGGGDFFLAGSRFVLDGSQADLLLRMLPSVVHIKEARGRETLRWSLDQMHHELRALLPGTTLVMEHLVHLMLVQALRIYLYKQRDAGIGWLYALADRNLRAAVELMHADPRHRWTVAELADKVNMSRTAFAVRFRKTVGLAPIEYLTRWRMLLAGDRLANSRDSIQTIAVSLGYESESAFGAAFKKWMGCSPRRYTRRKSL